jgi:hypothetical protein
MLFAFAASLVLVATPLGLNAVRRIDAGFIISYPYGSARLPSEGVPSLTLEPGFPTAKIDICLVAAPTGIYYVASLNIISIILEAHINGIIMVEFSINKRLLTICRLD